MDELSGWDLNWSSLKANAQEDSRITMSGETEGSRGFSDTEWEHSGTVTEVDGYEIHIEGDGKHDYYLKKSGVSIRVCRVLEETGDYTFCGLETVRIEDGDAA